MGGSFIPIQGISFYSLGGDVFLSIIILKILNNSQNQNTKIFATLRSLMRRYIILTITLAVIILGACDNAERNNLVSAVEEFPLIENLTEADLKSVGKEMAKPSGNRSNTFVQLARFFASDKKWLNKEFIRYTKNMGVPIGYLVDEAPSSYIKVDGRFFTIKIELFTKQYEDLVTSGTSFDYAVALDADIFHRYNSSLPAVKWNIAQRKIELMEIPIGDPNQEERWLAVKSIRDNLAIPVFFISLEQTFDSPEEDAKYGSDLNKGNSILDQDPCVDDNCSGGGGGGTPPPAPRARGTYFTIKAVNLFDKKDDSNDEFEFYIWPTTGQTVNKTTTHKFSGTVRNDASNYPVYYRDVNGDQGWENHIDTVCIAKLDGGLTYHFIPIEDDETAGEHDYSASSLRSKYITEYSFVDAAVRTGIVWTFATDNDDDSDDIYTEAGLKNVSEYNYSQLVGLNYLTTDWPVVNKVPDIDYIVALRRW